ncbi:MAG TPA: hydrogenase expression/formation protein HypE, partial [bacterium]|nr:hydrogenase expression/formation protein HypE [bacterium]
MDKIILAHGSGGQRTDELIKKLVLKYFKSKHLSHLPDAAKLDVKKKIAFTTDSFVVNPLFFPGGDIGKLAVCGTVNDLLTQAARPRFLSCGVILEEGLPLDDLEKIFSSMDREAKQAGIEIVTGDIKVVEKGKADRIYLNSSGIGEIIADVGFEKIKKGDAVIVTGGIGEHEIAVYMARMKEKGVLSDCASLTSVVLPLIEKFGGSIHFMRDPTRGGLAGVVLEIAETARTDITINEGSVPVRKEVRVT